MKVKRLPIDELHEAPWNPNEIGEEDLKKLVRSIEKYGLVENFVVRLRSGGGYEVLSGNQRLKACQALSFDEVPCVVVDVDDVQAMLLAQALNRLRGEDDLGRKAAMLQRVLEVLPEEEVLSILPETAQSLRTLATLGRESLAAQLQAWQQAKAVRLRALEFKLTPAQLEVVEEALARVFPEVTVAKGESPNKRGTALYLLCKRVLEREAV